MVPSSLQVQPTGSSSKLAHHDDQRLVEVTGQLEILDQRTDGAVQFVGERVHVGVVVAVEHLLMGVPARVGQPDEHAAVAGPNGVARDASCSSQRCVPVTGSLVVGQTEHGCNRLVEHHLFGGSVVGGVGGHPLIQRRRPQPVVETLEQAVTLVESLLAVCAEVVVLDHRQPAALGRSGQWGDRSAKERRALNRSALIQGQEWRHRSAARKLGRDDRADVWRLCLKCRIGRVSRLHVEDPAVVDGLPASDRTKDAQVVCERGKLREQRIGERNVAVLLDVGVCRVPGRVFDVERVEL